MPILHIVIPFFNEPATLRPCVERIIAAPLPDGWSRRLILVDDHSDPPGRAAADDLAAWLVEKDVDHRLLRHEFNRGKGAALQTGFNAVLNDHDDDHDVVIIQDADLEYDPNDYAALLGPIIAGRSRVVYGTRWGPHRPLRRVTSRLHAFGNAVLTWLSNLLTGYGLRDMECCYKVMTVDVLRRVRPMLSEERFGIEPQITAALSRLGLSIEEVPISYEPRGFEHGKKIGIKDGVRAMFVIIRERFRTVDEKADAEGHPVRYD